METAEAVNSLSALRQRLRAVGATAIGAGLHPTGAFGDVVCTTGSVDHFQTVACVAGFFGQSDANQNDAASLVDATTTGDWQ